MANIKRIRSSKLFYDDLAANYINGTRIVNVAKDMVNRLAIKNCTNKKKLRLAHESQRISLHLGLKARGIKLRDDRIKIDVSKAIRYYKNGLLMREIAEIFNCTKSAVSLMLKKHGVATPRRI